MEDSMPVDSLFDILAILRCSTGPSPESDQEPMPHF